MPPHLGWEQCCYNRQGEWRPVAFASRSMSETECRYAQIEKEALAVTWACEKILRYLLGLKFVIETDHKPLVPLLSTKILCLGSGCDWAGLITP